MCLPQPKSEKRQEKIKPQPALHQNYQCRHILSDEAVEAGKHFCASFKKSANKEALWSLEII